MMDEGFDYRSPTDRSESVSRRQLIRASVLVVFLGVVGFVTVVLPAEFGVDPTGVGNVTGLTEMGVFKVQADSQFAADAARLAAQQSADSMAAEGAPTSSP